MKKSWIVAGVIALLLIIFVGGSISSYNNLNALNQDVKNKYSQIDNQLKRRNDLIPNLVATVKGYASHEQKVFANISDARAKMAGAKSFTDRDQASSELSGALSRLIMLQENYPNLKADTQFQGLSDELAGTENRIATARKDYNDAATLYNTKINNFPTMIIARMGGFTEKDLFKATEGEKQTPQVKF